MKTNCLCDTPRALAFVAGEKGSGAALRPVHLAKDALWRSTDRHSGVAIEVLDGRIWLTVEGDPRDHVLHKGQSFRSEGSMRVVAQSLGASARMLVG